MTVEDRISALEAMVTSQHSEITRLKEKLATAAPPRLVDEVRPSDQHQIGAEEPGEATPSTSRRRLLTGGALAAGAAVVGATAAPQTAAAADGANMRIGVVNASEEGNTHLRGDGAVRYNGRNILTVSDQNNTSSFEAAIGAYGEGDRVFNGLYAYTGGRDSGDTSTGHAVVARNSGGRGHLLLNGGGTNPTNDTYAHREGTIRKDSSSNLWYCTQSGTPGTWRRLAGPQSAGALHTIAPARVYDSRFDDGPLASGFNRVVSVGNAIDVSTGELAQFNVVAAGATSIFFNVTIVDTIGSGFVLVAPGTATEITSSTLNWTGAGQILANASLTTLDDDRNVRVFVGGGGTTHFIIDITGYTI